MVYFLAFFALVAVDATAAQIFGCKTMQGGSYWSSAPCSNSGGYMVDQVTVPDGMSFQEQAKFADQLRGNQQSARNAEDQAIGRQRECGSIDAELAQIWGRYNNWQFNQAEQISRDQIRTRELNARRSRLGCQSR